MTVAIVSPPLRPQHLSRPPKDPRLPPCPPPPPPPPLNPQRQSERCNSPISTRVISKRYFGQFSTGWRSGKCPPGRPPLPGKHGPSLIISWQWKRMWPRKYCKKATRRAVLPAIPPFALSTPWQGQGRGRRKGSAGHAPSLEESRLI